MYTMDKLRAIAPLRWNYTIQMRLCHETHAQVCYHTSAVYLPFCMWPLHLLRMPGMVGSSDNRCQYCMQSVNFKTLPNVVCIAIMFSLQTWWRPIFLHNTISLISDGIHGRHKHLYCLFWQITTQTRVRCKTHAAMCHLTWWLDCSNVGTSCSQMAVFKCRPSDTCKLTQSQLVGLIHTLVGRQDVHLTITIMLYNI